MFIAHSLGGIILKKTLFQAKNDKRYGAIYRGTLGIIFLGTPHRGSKMADYGKVLSNVAVTFWHTLPSKLVAALRLNSDSLKRLNQDFRHQLPKYEIISFYKMETIAFLSSLVQPDLYIHHPSVADNMCADC